MKYVCSKCGKTADVSTRAPRCHCGGLWELDFQPPRFDLSMVDRSEWSLFRYRKFMALEDESWRDVTLGEGIAIGQPMRGEIILRLAKKHGVRFVHAPEAEILAARAALAQKGIYCEHTTAANYAAYLQYCRQYGPTPDCLITMCGAGLKSDH